MAKEYLERARSDEFLKNGVNPGMINTYEGIWLSEMNEVLRRRILVCGYWTFGNLFTMEKSSSQLGPSFTHFTSPSDRIHYNYIVCPIFYKKEQRLKLVHSDA